MHKDVLYSIAMQNNLKVRLVNTKLSVYNYLYVESVFEGLSPPHHA